MQSTTIVEDITEHDTVKRYIDIQGDSMTSISTIGTGSLGPCIAILLDFIHNSKNRCIMQHYAHLEDQENKSEVEKVV